MKSNKTKATVYEIVTNTILEMLTQGEIPWKKCWAIERPTSYATGKLYSGLNALYLNALTMKKGYERNVWLTFNQAKKTGGNVRKGAKSAIISYYKMIKDKKDEKRMIPLFRYFRVFNVAQCDGVPMERFPIVENNIGEKADAESVWTNYLNNSGVTFIESAGINPCYAPSKDAISMPLKGQFQRVDEYYSTLFHEAGHSTGHPSRLNRKDPGTDAYGKEELVAEFCAAFLCAHTGIEQTVDNSAAYIQGWSKALKNDPRLVSSAASKGEKAAEYILGG